MKILVRFTFRGYRGKLVGLYITTEERLAALIGKHVYFGEVLGKHSEVEGKMEASMFEVIKADQDKLEWFEKSVGSVGTNPEPIYDERAAENRYGDPDGATNYPALPVMS